MNQLTILLTELIRLIVLLFIFNGAINYFFKKGMKNTLSNEILFVALFVIVYFLSYLFW